MIFFTQLPNHTVIVLTLFSILLLTSCSDNPASNNGDDHTDPEGLELVHDNEVIFEYTLSEGVTEHSHLHYQVGEEYLFEVHFLDENGEHIHTEELGSEYSLGWEVENENMLEIHQHEGDGPWTFHLQAISEGATKVQFKLNHGSHSDLATPAVDQENAIEFHVDADSGGEHQH